MSAMPATLESIRTPLPGSDCQPASAFLDFGGFTCDKVRLISEDGGSGLVYEGISADYYGTQSAAAAKLVIKECYPYESAAFLQREDDALKIADDAPTSAKAMFERHLENFRAAFSKHTYVYQGPAREQVSVPGRVCEANGTAYIVTDVSNGVTLDEAAERMDFTTKLKVLIRLCEALGAIHESGYVYLDCKPSNILVVQSSTGEERRFTGDVRLFDFDSMLAIDDLGAPDVIVPGSGEWSAYEQTHAGYASAVSERSDIYAVGALLFWMVVGRTPTSNEVIHAYGKWVLDDGAVVEPAVKEAGENARDLVRKVLENTLTVDPKKRYESIADLSADLELLRDAVTDSGVDALADQRAAEAVELNKKKTFRIVVGALIVVLCLVLAAFAAMRSSSDSHEPDIVEGTWYSLSDDMVSEDVNITSAFQMAEYLDGAAELTINEDGTWRLYYTDERNSYVGEWELIGETGAKSEAKSSDGLNVITAGLLQSDYMRVYGLTLNGQQGITLTVFNAEYPWNMWGYLKIQLDDDSIAGYFARENTAAHGDDPSSN